MLLEQERNYCLGMDALASVCSWNTNGIIVFGHGCTGSRMLLEQERNYCLAIDALVAVCSWNTNGIMVWALMHWFAHALGTRTESWFGHGCSAERMLLEHERNSHRTSGKPPAYPPCRVCTTAEYELCTNYMGGPG